VKAQESAWRLEYSKISYFCWESSHEPSLHYPIHPLTNNEHISVMCQILNRVRFCGILENIMTIVHNNRADFIKSVKEMSLL